MKKREKLFAQLIEIIGKNYIRYALLGNTDAYPEKIGSDVDIMVLPEDVGLLHSAIWHFGVKSSGTHVAQMIQHEPVAFYYVVIRLEEGSVATIQPDVCTDYYRNGRRLLSASEMLQDTEIACDSTGQPKGFHVLAPEKEFIYYLLKKIDKGALSEDQFAHLRNQFFKNPEGALALSRRFWSEQSVQVIQQAFKLNQPHLLHEQLPFLRQDLHGRFIFSISDMIKRLLLKVNRCLHPTGFVINLCGDTKQVSVMGREIVALLGEAFRRQMIINPSELGFLNRLILPYKIVKARIFSTLVILLGERVPWITPINAKVFKKRNGVRLVVPGKPEYVLDKKPDEKISFMLFENLLDVLSERTRRRCRHFNRNVNREGAF